MFRSFDGCSSCKCGLVSDGEFAILGAGGGCARFRTLHLRTAACSGEWLANRHAEYPTPMRFVELEVAKPPFHEIFGPVDDAERLSGGGNSRTKARTRRRTGATPFNQARRAPGSVKHFVQVPVRPNRPSILPRAHAASQHNLGTGAVEEIHPSPSMTGTQVVLALEIRARKAAFVIPSVFVPIQRLPTRRRCRIVLRVHQSSGQPRTSAHRPRWNGRPPRTPRLRAPYQRRRAARRQQHRCRSSWEKPGCSGTGRFTSDTSALAAATAPSGRA